METLFSNSMVLTSGVQDELWESLLGASIVKHIVLTNYHATLVRWVKVWRGATVTDATLVLAQTNLEAAGGRIEFEGVMVVKLNEFLFVEASHATSIAASVDGVEIS